MSKTEVVSPETLTLFLHVVRHTGRCRRYPRLVIKVFGNTTVSRTVEDVVSDPSPIIDDKRSTVGVVQTTV